MDKLIKFWETVKYYFKIAFTFSKNGVITAVEKIDWEKDELLKLFHIINDKLKDK